MIDLEFPNDICMMAGPQELPMTGRRLLHHRDDAATLIVDY